MNINSVYDNDPFTIFNPLLPTFCSIAGDKAKQLLRELNTASPSTLCEKRDRAKPFLYKKT
jgi:hypothetical protein